MSSMVELEFEAEPILIPPRDLPGSEGCRVPRGIHMLGSCCRALTEASGRM